MKFSGTIWISYNFQIQKRILSTETIRGNTVSQSDLYAWVKWTFQLQDKTSEFWPQADRYSIFVKIFVNPLIYIKIARECFYHKVSQTLMNCL